MYIKQLFPVSTRVPRGRVEPMCPGPRGNTGECGGGVYSALLSPGTLVLSLQELTLSVPSSCAAVIPGTRKAAEPKFTQS